jgi:hypothetical protein
MELVSYANEHGIHKIAKRILVREQDIMGSLDLGNK